MAAAPETARGGNAVLKAFDAHHPPSHAIMDQCVHCGFCLPVCPTYQLWAEEMDPLTFEREALLQH